MQLNNYCPHLIVAVGMNKYPATTNLPENSKYDTHENVVTKTYSNHLFVQVFCSCCQPVANTHTIMLYLPWSAMQSDVAG